MSESTARSVHSMVETEIESGSETRNPSVAWSSWTKLALLALLLGLFLGLMIGVALDVAVARENGAESDRNRPIENREYSESSQANRGDARSGQQPKIVYPKRTDLDFEGTSIQGEMKNPGEFYFQRRPEEKFDSLVKRRKNFHQEMLRDVVLTK